MCASTSRENNVGNIVQIFVVTLANKSLCGFMLLILNYLLLYKHTSLDAVYEAHRTHGR